jgi:hypothetical protein
MSVAYNITISVMFIPAIGVTDKQEALPNKMKCLLLYLSQ